MTITFTSISIGTLAYMGMCEIVNHEFNDAKLIVRIFKLGFYTLGAALIASVMGVFVLLNKYNGE